MLFTALAGTTARADTIVTSGGNLTAINGIAIDGTTYNITFGTTVDETFSGNTTGATDAAAAILPDLYGYDFVDGLYENLGIYEAPSLTYVMSDINSLGTWEVKGEVVSSLFSGEVADGVGAWVQFAPVTTPEPGTLTLTLSGLGLLGLFVAIRKRGVHGLPQATKRA